MNRRGFALIFVVFVVAALELLALATLALATHEAVAVHAALRTSAARRAAEAVLRRFIRDWPHTQVEQLAVASRTIITDTSGVQLTVERHAPGLYHVTAAAPAGSSFIGQAMVLRTLDAVAALEEGVQAMRSLGLIADSLVCAATFGGTPSFSSAAQPYALGGVFWHEAATIADSTVTGSVVLAAADTLGTLQPRLLYSPGDLAVSGRGAGILLVDGHLTMLAGTEFTGIIVVRSTAVLASDSRVIGSIRVQGQTGLPAGQLVFSPCSAAWALAGAPGSRRLVGAARRFIPAF